MDKRPSEKSELIPDMGSCGRGRLNEGITKYVVEVENEVYNHNNKCSCVDLRSLR
jgi:hypothetical protein